MPINLHTYIAMEPPDIAEEVSVEEVFLGEVSIEKVFEQSGILCVQLTNSGSNHHFAVQNFWQISGELVH